MSSQLRRSHEAPTRAWNLPGRARLWKKVLIVLIFCLVALEVVTIVLWLWSLPTTRVGTFRQPLTSATIDSWWTSTTQPDPPDFSGDVMVASWPGVDFSARRAGLDEDGVLNIAASLLVWKTDYPLEVCLESLIRSDIMRHRVYLFIWTNAAESPAVDFLDGFLRREDARFADVIRLKHVEGLNMRIVLPRILIMKAAREYHDNATGTKVEMDWLLEMHDDLLFPTTWIEKLLRFDGPNVGILQGYLWMKNITSSVSAELEGIDKLNAIYGVTESGVHVSQPTHPWLVKMRMVSDIGYYTTDMVLGAEDSDFWYRIFRSPMWDLVSVAGVYFVHTGSGSRSTSKDKVALSYYIYKYANDDFSRRTGIMHCESITAIRKNDGKWYSSWANVEARLAWTLKRCVALGANAVKDYRVMDVTRSKDPIVAKRVFPTRAVILAAFRERY